MFDIVFSKQAQKDFDKILQVPVLLNNVKKLLTLLKSNPLAYPPEFEKLIGDLNGTFSRRINKEHRLVYQIIDSKTVKIIRMWTHYE